MNFNRVVLGGNLTRDPELTYTKDGTPICNFTLAINSFFTDSKGQKQEYASFIPIVVWRKQAESTAEYLKKGRPVLIEGRLKQDRWVSKEGQKRSTLKVVAGIVRFLGQPPQVEGDKQPIDNEEEQ